VASNDDAMGEYDSYDDDENDNAASQSYYDDEYSYYGDQRPKCSKIAYTVPLLTGVDNSTNSTGGEESTFSSCSTFYLQQSCRGLDSCSGRTRVAGGIAAPSSQPSGAPTAAPSGVADWKESMYVFQFRARVDMRFKCGGSKCTHFAALDYPAQEAFREMFASVMSSVALSDVSLVSVSVTSSFWPQLRGLFSTQVITANASAIPVVLAGLSAEIQSGFSTDSELLAALFLHRSTALGSAIVMENYSDTMTVEFYDLAVSEDFRLVEEVQSYVPSVVPSPSPTTDPTRGIVIVSLIAPILELYCLIIFFFNIDTFFCDPFEVVDSHMAVRNYAACGITACPGSVLVANVCEEFSGDTFFRLVDDEGNLVASNDDAISNYDSVDDDDADNSVNHDEYGSSYSFDDDFVTEGDACGDVDRSDDFSQDLCSKIRYVVPMNSTGCRTFYLHQGCYGSGSCGSCSGHTRVAGGVAAPTSQPSGFPTAAPTTATNWKESMYVFSFKARVKVALSCKLCTSSDDTNTLELDEPAEEAFRAVLASTLVDVSLEDVTTVKMVNGFVHMLSGGSTPTVEGTFSLQSVTSNLSAIPEIISERSSELEIAFSSSNSLGQLFVDKSVSLESNVVTVNTTATFLSQEVSKEYSYDEVQTFAPSIAPSSVPSAVPTMIPSSSPTSSPSRGKCICTTVAK
jgi:hypothetical protein